MLKGSLRGLARSRALISVLGSPRNDAESALLVIIARLLGDEETATLITMIQRSEEAEAGQYAARTTGANEPPDITPGALAPSEHSADGAHDAAPLASTAERYYQ
jgi:hypothetical protein